MNPKYEKLAFAGVLVALGIVLPFAVSHGLGIAGTVLLPMHIPVFICGLVCGGALGRMRFHTSDTEQSADGHARRISHDGNNVV